MQICSNYNGTEYDIDRLGLNKTYYCPKVKDYTIGGAYAAPNYRYIEVGVYKCYNATSNVT